MIKGINKSKTIVKHISCGCRCEYDGRKCSLKQKQNNDKCQSECIKPIKNRAPENDYAPNPSICACQCDKDCEIKEYVKYYTRMKHLIDDLVVTCDETADMPETTHN